jgi:hypothetical protein
LRWAVLVGVLAATTFLGTADLALAAAAVSLDPRPDGTLVLVGSGWRPGQELVISLGTDAFPALADATGSFEIPTGLLVTSGPPLSITIRHPDASSLAFAHLGPPADPGSSNPFAVLFAESLAMGAKVFAFSAGGLSLTALATRAVRARGRARASR